MHRLARWVFDHHKSRSSFRRLPHALLRDLLINRSFVTSIRCRRDSDSTAPPKIRWFKQLYDGLTSSRQPLDPENEDVDEDPEATLVRERIKQLEAELEELRGGQGSTIEPLLNALSEENRNKVRQALRQSEHDHADRPATEEEVRLVEEQMMQVLPKKAMEKLLALGKRSLLGDLEDQLDLTPQEAHQIRRLNQSLRKLADKPTDEGYQKKVWHSYVQCKYNAPPFMHLVSDEVWDILWKSQFDGLLDIQERAKRLCLIYTDMIECGKELTVDQKLVFIQSLVLDGDYVKAMTYWQSQQVIIRADGTVPLEFDILGVRLHALQGNPRKAQKLALDAIDTRGKGVSHILVPVIEAWIRSGGELGVKHAWAVYLHLKSQKGSDIELEDYDTISMGFLKFGRTDLALGVFKDMMLTGESTKYESTELYKKSLGLVGELQAISINAKELTKISLTALTALPTKFQNKFFYGSWMKRLIGMGEVDSAAMVIDLMYERGVKPDAKHLNGIMGAWLRSGHTKSKEKAEQLGWAMIYERLDLVARRSRNDAPAIVGTNNSTDIKKVNRVGVPAQLKRTVSPATIETFSLLLLSYERRGMLKDVECVRDYLSRAQIYPNAYFMNHLLYAELRRGNHQESWSIYKSMSSTIRPDLETFACLWDCQKAHLNRLSIYKSDRFPSHRVLFCEMISWYSALRPKSRADVLEIFSKDLYDQVIRCCCLAQDLEGTLVALYALHEYFNLSPDQDTARMVTLQVASMGVGEPKNPGRRRTRLSGNLQHKKNIARMAQVLELLREERERVLQERGVVLDDAERVQEQIWLLAEFLRTVLKRGGESEDGLERTAWEMGVGGLKMRDPHLGVEKEIKK